jgi:hypothetical protein
MDRAIPQSQQNGGPERLAGLPGHRRVAKSKPARHFRDGPVARTSAEKAKAWV